MRRVNVTLALLALLIAGCGGTASTQHPLTNNLDPAFKTVEVRTLAALPFATDIADDEDPDKIAASMAEGKFYPALNAGSGFTILPASEVRRILEKENLLNDYRIFCKKWISDQSDVDTGFIKNLASHMKVDGVIVGAVDVWHQAPVDISQSGAARTSVGVLVGLFEGSTGKRLWLGRDENFKEALRYTPNDTGSDLARNQTRGEMERTNLRTATGVYAPPDFPAVVDGVVASLVAAFPKRVEMNRPRIVPGGATPRSGQGSGGGGGAADGNPPESSDEDERWMRLALDEAMRAAEAGEVPVGAVVVLDGRLLGRGHNRTEATHDPTAHAEIMAIGAASAALGDWRLTGADIYVTLEPCSMCAGAIQLGRFRRVVFGPRDPKFGACGSVLNVVEAPRLNHQVGVVEGVLADESRFALRQFFRRLRQSGRETASGDPFESE